MTEIGFYQLRSTPLDTAVARLIERALSGGHRAVILASSETRVEQLNSKLWSFSPTSFLPHGSKLEGRAAEQPVWLTAEDENPNGADLLVLTEGMQSARLQSYRRCVDIFDGRDAEALAAARQRWVHYKGDGHSVSYWEQTEQGGWESRSRSNSA